MNSLSNKNKKDHSSLFQFVPIVKRKKIVGRGDKTAGRGTKGQKARKSGRVRLGFEGGQTPFYLRFPKKGFERRAKKRKNDFLIINLESFENDEKISSGSLLNFSESKKEVKILGKGDLSKKLNIVSHFFSSSSIEKIKNAGGTIEILKKYK